MLQAASLLLVPSASPASAAPPDESAEIAAWSATRDARMAWWRDARFGMFIHWGLYSPAGGFWDGKRFEQHYAEWIQHWAAVPCAEYARQMQPKFVPDPGFADTWAELAQAAGMRYAVMTAKHHDGFTLFNSAQPYSVANDVAGGTNISPAGRDVAREFADAIRARGLRAGFYYSLLDWQHPDAYEMALPAYPKVQRTRDHARYLAYIRGHVDELLTNYGSLSTIWFDYSDQAHQGAAWGAAKLMSDLRTQQPEIVVNNRLFLGLENRNGDYGTPEKYVPPTGLPGMDWEVNHTLNESYGFSAHDVGWKDTATVVRLLCDIVSKGGNLLLNIGPDAHGRVPEAAQKTLRGVGEWMKVNGEAIYGTTASPFARLPWGRATQKPGTLYLMVFNWPADGVLWVPIRNRITEVNVLGSGATCSAVSNDASVGAALKLPLPTHSPCTVVRVSYDGALDALPFAIAPSTDGSLVLLPHDATLEGPSLKVEQVGVIGEVTHNIGYWLDPSATAAWPLRLGVSQGGVYRVELELACADAAAGARMRFEVDDCGGAEFTVPATGGWQSYHTVEVGRVTLPAGLHRAMLRALSKPGEAVVNVRAVRLVRET